MHETALSVNFHQLKFREMITNLLLLVDVGAEVSAIQ